VEGEGVIKGDMWGESETGTKELVNASLAALIPSAPRARDTKKASGELAWSKETDADAGGCVGLKR
jgi:hypothetical protein